jgi:hypothetical protein
MLYTYIQHYRAHFTSWLVKPGREVLSLSVYLLPPLTGQGPWEWRNILRTNYERGASGMYLLLHPFPISQWYIRACLLLGGSSPIPIHHLISSQEACALSISPSLYLHISIPETSLIPRSLAHSDISELIPVWTPGKLWTNLWSWANWYLWAVSPDLYDLWAKI